METTTLIKASAEITRIASFKVGDVYKRVETMYDGAKLRFGVITDAMNNGEDAAIVAVEVSPEYSGVSTQIKTFASGAEAALFAATPDEVAVFLADLLEKADTAVDLARRALDKAEADRGRVNELYRDSQRDKLSAPALIGIES